MKFLEEIETILKNEVSKLDKDIDVTISFSDRPELSNFQSNICFSLAKKLGKSPLSIAEEICKKINNEYFEAFAVAPGFININLKNKYFSQILKSFYIDERLGIEQLNNNKVVFDYGGPNIAKPLHVGHLRSAIIGETIKRLSKFVGQEVVADVHLGDYGLQMGLTIAQILDEKDCSYYFSGEGEKLSLTANELENFYPKAAARAKTDENFKKKAQEITVKLQHGEKGYYQLWKEIVKISVEDVKKIYDILNVDFDKWYGESDSQKFVPEVFDILNKKSLVEQSNRAEIVEVANESDNSPSSTPFEVVISYDGDWYGRLGDVDHPSERSGSGNQTYRLSCAAWDEAFANIQKTDYGSGELKVQLLKNSKVIAENTTTAENGVVSVYA